MKKPKKRQRLLFITVALFGVTLVVVEAYILCPPLRNGAVSVLESVGADDSLVGMLSDRDHEVRDSACEALVRRGPKAVPALIRGVEHSDSQGRLFALVTLQRIGPLRVTHSLASRRVRKTTQTQVFAGPQSQRWSLSAMATRQLSARW